MKKTIIKIIIIIALLIIITFVNKLGNNNEKTVSGTQIIEEEYNTDESTFEFYTEKNEELEAATAKIPTFNSIVKKATIYSESDEKRYGFHSYKLNTTSEEKSKEIIAIYLSELKKYNVNLKVGDWYISNDSLLCDITNTKYFNTVMTIGFGKSNDEGNLVCISIWKEKTMRK